MKTKPASLFAVLTVISWLAAHAAEPPTIPEEVKTEIRNRVDNLYSTAIVVGVLDANGASYFSYGTLDPDRGGAVNEDSLFEVGGLCKTFTATILADMAERGELSLTGLIQDYLPAGRIAPVYGTEQSGIDFTHLATHMSGLPNMPSNASPDPLSASIPGYTVDQMYDFLGSYQLTRAPGAKYEASNYGIGLLGQILCHIKGMEFDALLRQRVTDVLGLKDTVVKMSPEQETRFVTPYQGVIRCPRSDWGALAPTGQLYSSARDVLAYLGANLGLVQSPLYSAMTDAQCPRVSLNPSTQIGLVWQTLTSGSVARIENSGRGGATCRYAGFIPDQKRAVVVLATGFLTANDLGPYLLSPALPKFASYRVPSQVPTRVLRQYVGKYTGAWRNVPERTIDIGLEQGHLTFVWSGDNVPFTLYPVTSFETNMYRLPPTYYDTAASTVQFDFDTAGQVTSLNWIGSWGSAGPIPKVASLSLPPELALSRSQSGATLELIGDPGSSYTIEWSTDLRTWNQLVPNVASGTSIPISSAEPIRLYRARE